MNESADSDDVHLIQSSTSTKPKIPDLWKHLKQKCWRCGKKGKGYSKNVHIMEANMNESAASNDIGLIQSSTSSKPKNPDLWKHLKEANMNESAASDDVCLIQSSTTTKPKIPDLWKHLKSFPSAWKTHHITFVNQSCC